MTTSYSITFKMLRAVAEVHKQEDVSHPCRAITPNLSTQDVAALLSEPGSSEMSAHKERMEQWGGMSTWQAWVLCWVQEMDACPSSSEFLHPVNFCRVKKIHKTQLSYPTFSSLTPDSFQAVTGHSLYKMLNQVGLWSDSVWLFKGSYCKRTKKPHTDQPPHTHIHMLMGMCARALTHTHTFYRIYCEMHGF